MLKNKDITAIILAGGQSSRMGSDKGLTMFNNKPFIQHIIDVVRPMCREIIIVSSNLAYDVFECTRQADIITNVGPLGGIHSGLKHSTTNVNLIISCDVPMISKPVIEQLYLGYSGDYEVIQTMVDNKSMPLVALYHKSCISPLENWLANDKRRVREFVESLRLKTVTIAEEQRNDLLNINSPQQLKKIVHAIGD